MAEEQKTTLSLPGDLSTLETLLIAGIVGIAGYVYRLWTEQLKDRKEERARHDESMKLRDELIRDLAMRKKDDE